MQIRYFDAAWNDIVHSPGWFAKLLQLALVNLIPIFGQIVSLGYLYGWAREIAWGVHEPMPRKLFANEDGKLYRRGFYILVLSIVLGIVIGFVATLGSGLSGASFSLFDGQRVNAIGLLLAAGGLFSLAGFLLSIVSIFYQFVANMRISVYDRLSAGFQVGKIFKMMKQDLGGLARIFGMYLAVGIVASLVLSVVLGIVFVVFGVTVGAGVLGAIVNATSESALEQALRDYFLSGNLGAIVVGGLLLTLVSSYLTLVVDQFVDMLVVRALGYWTMQFDVPQWRGQDDPMPFELAGQGVAAAAVPYAAAQPPQYQQTAGTAPYATPQPYQQPYQQPEAFAASAIPAEQPLAAGAAQDSAAAAVQSYEQQVAAWQDESKAAAPAVAAGSVFEQARAAAAEAAQTASAEFATSEQAFVSGQASADAPAIAGELGALVPDAVDADAAMGDAAASAEASRQGE